jgi:hypothetical protein
MYADPVAGATRDARWARGAAVAAVTAPGVLTAQLLTAHAAASPTATLVVSAVVALVACALPPRTPHATAALAALAQLAGHAVLAVMTATGQQARSGCLSVVGRGADLGVRYALVHDPSCPPGTLRAGPALAAVVAALAAAALVLLGHAVLAGLTGVLVAAAAAGLDVVRRLAAAVLPVPGALVGVRAVPATIRAPQLPEPPVLTARWQPGTALRRGPPVRQPVPS